ncbi:MAG TPA: CBS domain-containing protein [Gammaproteobacteria bacterium]|nr:CBS domain-containing protein [Gammaproteobacteria bacterium]
MSERTEGEAPSRSWLERLGQVLSGEPRDRRELVEILREAQQRHLLDADALAMIEGVLEVSEMQVREIMIPRSQMVVVERDASLEEILPVITESAHSRFPVIGDSKDEVVGILLAKDLLPCFMGERPQGFNMRDLLRPAVFIPESKRLNVLLKEFRASRNHMAIVVDEYGGVDGLVTIEDVLEQIVGEIADEHDVEDEIYIMKHSDRQYTVKALTPIAEFNEYFGADLSDEEYDTIGGYVMRQFAHLPRRGETVDIGPFHFKVLHADSRRIHLLQLTLGAQEAARDGRRAAPP